MTNKKAVNRMNIENQAKIQASKQEERRTDTKRERKCNKEHQWFFDIRNLYLR